MKPETLSQLFDVNVTQYNKPDLLNYRGQDGAFYKISSNEFKDSVINFALGLKNFGIKPESKIILISENRPEWHIVDFACHLLNAVVVPIYPTLIAEQIEYIIQNSDSELVVLSDLVQANKIDTIRKNLKKVKNIVAMDQEAAKDEVVLFEQVLKSGREQDDTEFYDKAIQLAKPDVIATIIYTSGTTGVPKGVMLSHKNVVSNVLACDKVLDLNASDRGLSFLPLSHVFERMVDYLYFYKGLSIIYSGIENVAHDVEKTKPTIMASVPRFYEKVKSKITSTVEEKGGINEVLFNWALNVGRRKSEHSMAGEAEEFLLKIYYKMADKLVLSKIRDRLGGNIKYFIAGGAPLSKEVAHFFLAAGLKILEGYGLTETSPVISFNPPNRPIPGTVGQVLPGNEVKIAEDGEILTRGPNVMMGYYKMPAETDEVMSEGWFHTGDIGRLDNQDYLHITDRKKQLIVTSGGKNVAPQAIEKEIENSKYIEQVLLIGEKRNFISALIVPDFDALKKVVIDHNISKVKNEELIENPVIIDLIQDEIEKHQNKFSNYEKIRKFHLLFESFTIENGYLTPTLKIKRQAVQQDYSEAIEEMYAATD